MDRARQEVCHQGSARGEEEKKRNGKEGNKMRIDLTTTLCYLSQVAVATRRSYKAEGLRKKVATGGSSGCGEGNSHQFIGATISRR